jgi:hypothetical protein
MGGSANNASTNHRRDDVKDKKDKRKLGATGKYPEGKLNKTDEGELRFAIGPHVSGGIGIEFGKAVKWIVLPKETAIEMAFLLLRHAGVKLGPVPKAASPTTASPPDDHTEHPDPSPTT